MKKGKIMSAFMVSILLAAVTGCGLKENASIGENGVNEEKDESVEGISKETDMLQAIRLTDEIMELEAGLEAVRFDGDYKFSDFLAQGGASSDREVVEFLAENLLNGMTTGGIMDGMFGCSTLTAADAEGNVLFGRNFDWNSCNAIVVEAHPENGYASVSTVNADFITQGAGMAGTFLKLDQVKTLAALYAPLDGMNEKGFAISVNMIQDSDSIEQNTPKPDITTTTAVRLLLDQAADVEEAVAILEEYDMHASMGFMVHFAMADRSGRSVAVEYIGNEMTVVETPAVTNFYLAEGEKNGIGTQQSHERYDILMDRLRQTDGSAFGMEDMRDALDSVSKDNFGEFESTEWSIVMNLATGEMRYYHREDYETEYIFLLEGGENG